MTNNVGFGLFRGYVLGSGCSHTICSKVRVLALYFVFLQNIKLI